MKELAHTPGPYRVADMGAGPYLNIITTDGHQLAAVFTLGQAQSPANAFLFAASPSLLAALKEVVAAFDKMDDMKPALDSARIAIAAATGGNA